MDDEKSVNESDESFELEEENCVRDINTAVNVNNSEEQLVNGQTTETFESVTSEGNDYY